MENSYDELVSVLFSFCDYFHDKMIAENFGGIQIGGFKRNKDSKKAVESITRLLGTDFSDNNFITLSVIMFENLAKHDFIEKNFHLQKESERVFKFITSMLKKGFKINDIELTSVQKNILRIVHSQLSDVFNEDIPSHISQQVSNHLDRALNGSSILKRQSKEYVAARDNYTFVRLKRLIEKLLKNKHNAEIAKMHIEAHTAPMHLFFRNFPKPTIKNNEVYIQKFNDIIRKAIEVILELDEATYNQESEKLNNEISAMLSSFKEDENLNDLNIDEVYSACTDIVQNDLKPSFKRSVNKAAKCVQRPYTLKEFEQYFTQNNNRKNDYRDVQFDDSSYSQSSRSSFNGRYDSRNRNHNHNRNQQRNRSNSKRRSYQRNYSTPRQGYSQRNSRQDYFDSRQSSRRGDSDEDEYSFRNSHQGTWRDQSNNWR